MTISEAVRTYILAQTSFSNLVSTRLYPERAGQGLTSDFQQELETPYVTYHLELRDAAPTQNGPTLIIEATFAFIVVSRDYDEVFEVAEILRAIMTDFKGVMGGASGIQIEAVTWAETVGGHISAKAAQAGLFGALAEFEVLYIPQ